MFDKQSQAALASQFRQQHQGGGLLILPNIWDPLGAKLMEKLGYPSIATASVATAIANGYLDGEHIPFKKLLEIVLEISSCVQIPLTVDIERGFAGDDTMQLKENIRLLIEHGAIGINIEDSRQDHKNLNPIKEQCLKIEAIREMSLKYDVPLVINARTDVFMIDPGTAMENGIERARAYKSCGS